MMVESENSNFDYLVIGGGVAGLSLSLKLAKAGTVAVVVKNKLEESNTWYAQGGIASVFDPSDSFENHVKDTMVAGAGLCHESVVKMVVSEGPRLIEELIQYGATFDSEAGGHLHLTKEGGHSHRRVIHSKDVTGRVVAEALINSARRHPNIKIFEKQTAIDLITTDKVAPDFGGNQCLGAWFYDAQQGAVTRIQSRATFLCTGGHESSIFILQIPIVRPVMVLPLVGAQAVVWRTLNLCNFIRPVCTISKPKIFSLVRQFGVRVASFEIWRAKLSWIPFTRWDHLLQET